jgi:hypothetical protein
VLVVVLALVVTVIGGGAEVDCVDDVADVVVGVLEVADVVVGRLGVEVEVVGVAFWHSPLTVSGALPPSLTLIVPLPTEKHSIERLANPPSNVMGEEAPEPPPELNAPEAISVITPSRGTLATIPSLETTDLVHCVSQLPIPSRTVGSTSSKLELSTWVKLEAVRTICGVAEVINCRVGVTSL